MGDTKISALADIVTLAAGDKVAVADASDLTASKSATMTELNAYLQTLALASAQITTLGAGAAVSGTDLFPGDQGGTAKKITAAQLNTYIQSLALASAQITALPAASALAAANSFPVDQSGTAGEATLTQLVTLLQTLGMPRVLKLTGQHSISSATATKVTGLDMVLEAGTYVYTYTLIIQQAASTSDAPQFGINFSTGTAAVKAHGLRFYDATSAITAETHIMDNIGVKAFGYISGMASNAYTTTAPDMGTTVGVAATGANIMCFIEGIIVVTVQGTLELWRGAEGANASTTEVGSSLMVVRTA